MSVSNQEQDYGMFTEIGNAVVHAIVISAKANNMSWTQTYRALHQLAQEDIRFGEATDTAVRECVYDAIGAKARNENFYI